MVNERIVCPCCDGRGLLYKGEFTEFDECLFICDACEATWESPHKIENGYTNLSRYLESKGFEYNKVELINQDYKWYTILDIFENFYVCPLLERLIWMGDCYDINAVRHRMVKRSLLVGLEKELLVSVSLEKANKTCSECNHSF